MKCAYCTSYELQVTFTARVTSFFLHASYVYLCIEPVTSYILRTCFELLFIGRITSYFLTISYELLIIIGALCYIYH